MIKFSKLVISMKSILSSFQQSTEFIFSMSQTPTASNLPYALFHCPVSTTTTTTICVTTQAIASFNALILLPNEFRMYRGQTVGRRFVDASFIHQLQGEIEIVCTYNVSRTQLYYYNFPRLRRVYIIIIIPTVVEENNIYCTCTII